MRPLRKIKYVYELRRIAKTIGLITHVVCDWVQAERRALNSQKKSGYEWIEAGVPSAGRLLCYMLASFFPWSGSDGGEFRR